LKLQQRKLLRAVKVKQNALNFFQGEKKRLQTALFALLNSNNVNSVKTKNVHKDTMVISKIFIAQKIYVEVGDIYK
jgi:hypothetical protein